MNVRLRKRVVGAAVAVGSLASIVWLLHLWLGPHCTPHARVRAQVAILGEKVRAFRCDVGFLPAALSTLTAGDLPYGRYANEYDLTDSWGRALYYASDDRQGRFALFSLGRDGLPGGGDEDADIVFEGSLAPLDREIWRNRGSPVQAIDCSAYRTTPQPSLMLRQAAAAEAAKPAPRRGDDASGCRRDR
ncbi:type II secretion system protein GspG [Lysobacter yananisis]|uniref:Type II secretion system protein GspG n=1 Tax=Lysobacter yananisis TaxID=1003114 RepID=A0ABY9P5F5_9GAMM|nr:type II secretion system protein GspG [Lysobacter yananisis]WMT01361.1 type II secretion system protein GspG [Lysobacter yananisis]